MSSLLKEMTKSKEVKIGHYVGEFVTPGIGIYLLLLNVIMYFLIWNILGLALKL